MTIEQAKQLPHEVLSDLLKDLTTPEEWLTMDPEDQDWLLQAGVAGYLMSHPLEIPHERTMEILSSLAVSDDPSPGSTAPVPPPVTPSPASSPDEPTVRLTKRISQMTPEELEEMAERVHQRVTREIAEEEAFHEALYRVTNAAAPAIPSDRLGEILGRLAKPR